VRLSWSPKLNHGFDRLAQVFFLFVFLKFIIQHQVDWELDSTIYFGLLSMRLFLSCDSSHRFNRLIRVNLSFFYVFFINFFFKKNLIFQHRVSWESSFIICFNLLYTKFTWFQDEFDNLTQVNLSLFSISSFNIEFIENWVL
jgi:hypothetical protein